MSCADSSVAQPSPQRGVAQGAFHGPALALGRVGPCACLGLGFDQRGDLVADALLQGRQVPLQAQVFLLICWVDGAGFHGDSVQQTGPQAAF